MDRKRIENQKKGITYFHGGSKKMKRQANGGNVTVYNKILTLQQKGRTYLHAHILAFYYIRCEQNRTVHIRAPPSPQV